MDELLQALASKKWFTTVDLSSSYRQIEVDKKDSHKTAFMLPSGLYEFTTLPRGVALFVTEEKQLAGKIRHHKRSRDGQLHKGSFPPRGYPVGKMWCSGVPRD